MQAKMGLTLKVLDPTPNCPASVVAQQTVRTLHATLVLLALHSFAAMQLCRVAR